jgi:hypothetical protein
VIAGVILILPLHAQENGGDSVPVNASDEVVTAVLTATIRLKVVGEATRVAEKAITRLKDSLSRPTTETQRTQLYTGLNEEKERCDALERRFDPVTFTERIKPFAQATLHSAEESENSSTKTPTLGEQQSFLISRRKWLVIMELNNITEQFAHGT